MTVTKEMKYSLAQSQTMSKCNKFHVSDVYIGNNINDSAIAFANELLSQDKDSVVSLLVSYYSGKIYIPFQIVQEFLDKTLSLQALYFIGDHDILPTWCSISSIFSSLTVVFLKNISLTSEAARDLRQSIESNTTLQSFGT